MGGATFTPEIRNWRWYDDDGAVPTAALAAENTLASHEELNISRLRWSIAEVGGANGNGLTQALQYSTDQTNWNNFGAAPQHWNYADGQATAGNSLTTHKLTDANALGTYVEASGNTISIAKNTITEFDFAITSTASVTNDTTYYFRINLGGTPVPLGTGKTRPQMQATSPLAIPVICRHFRRMREG